MLNLYDYISPLDEVRMKNYISEWGVENGYIGNKIYFTEWRDNKKTMFHILGGKLIVKIPCEIPKEESLIKEEIAKLHTKHSDFWRAFRAHLTDLLNQNLISDKQYDDLDEIINTDNVLCTNEVPKSVKIKIKDKKGTLQIQQKSKPIRVIQKIINYFGFTDLMEEFEVIRIAHSMIYNEKLIRGNLCFSIHPMDFMTMSDNAHGWSSCMSWQQDGCYHEGTLEMMNSNNVICVYLEGKEPFHFSRNKAETSEKYTWTSKRWRQLFYVTKEIIVSGKAYPYKNKELTLFALEKLREMAKENAGWTYSFGPERYRDMIHVTSFNRMERNKNWLNMGNSTKHNIIFDSKGMYNDMLNANTYPYYCVRNKVNKMKIISYSGKAKCLCCKSDILEFDECAEYYNERYNGVKALLCVDCLSERECSYCGENHYWNTREFEDKNGISTGLICGDCWKNLVKECPICHEPMVVRHYTNLYGIREGKSLPFVQDNRDNFLHNLLACESCLEKMSNDKAFETVKIKLDPNRSHWSWQHEYEIKMFKKEYLKEHPNLEITMYEKNLKDVPFASKEE